MKSFINTSTMRMATMLFLMLLGVSTSWAQEQEEPVTISKATTADIGKVISTDGCIYASESDVTSGWAVAMIAYVDEQNHKGLAIALDNVYVYDSNTYKSSFQWDEAAGAVQTWSEDRAVAGGTWKVPTIQEWQQMLIGCGSEGEVSDYPESGTFTFTGINKKLAAISQYPQPLRYGYWSATEYQYETTKAWEIYFNDYSDQFPPVTFNGYNKLSQYGNTIRACLAFETSGGESGGETVTTNTYVSTFTGTNIIDNQLYLTSAENNNWVVSDTNCGIGCTTLDDEPCIFFDTPSTDNVTVLTPAFEISGEVSSITIKAAAGIESIVLNDNDGVFTKTEGNLFDVYTLTPQSGVSVNSIKITGEPSSIYYLNSITIKTTSSGGGDSGEGGESGNVIDSNTASINMPVSGDEVKYTIAQGVTSFNIYDDGGSESNYSDGCNGTVILTAPDGCKLQLTGSIISEPGYDYLKVWDGTSDEGEPAIEVSGTETLNTFTSMGKSIRIYFHSDSGSNDEGLNLTVTVIDPNNKHAINIESVQGGQAYLYLDPAESVADEDINIYFSPNQGYMTESISVVDANSNPVSVTGGKWYNNPSYAYFTMPNAAVTVTPTFTNAKTAAQGLYVNMPADYSTTWANIPEGVQSFNLYDDGGQNNTYSKGINSTIVLTAPENYLLQLTGTITALADETLTVKDGQSYNDKELKTAKSSSNGETTDIGTIISTGRYMRISFQTYYNENDYSGLDLTVTLINPNTQNDISITPTNNGSVVAKVGNSEVTGAKVNDVVTISATPNKDYVLADITVTDAYSNPVSVTGGTWYNNTATFTMPATAVTVTPVFEAVSSFEPYINMPKSGTLTATIPAAVSSFKVYDDGGKDNEYASNSNGTLVLTAPEGNMLHLKGSVKGNPDAKLTVWDGTDTTEDNAKLIDGAYSQADKEKLVGGVVSSGQDMTLQFVTGYNLSSFEGLNLNVTRVDVCLGNMGDNNETISQNDDKQGFNVALTGRTLYKDNKWNTLCLPFNVTLEGSPLEGATARSLTSANISGSTLNLTFSDAVDVLVAGTPYIIKWAAGDDIVSPVFEGVTVCTDKHDYDTNGDNNITDERVRFVGTYESTAFNAEDKSILLMGGSNTLFYPTANAGIATQRAYFKIGNDGDAQQAHKLTSFNFNEGQSGTTGMLNVSTNTEDIGEADTWYTLDGTQLQGKPTKKGIYIVNGKKVVIM